jgi:hypothetical protein
MFFFFFAIFISLFLLSAPVNLSEEELSDIGGILDPNSDQDDVLLKIENIFNKKRLAKQHEIFNLPFQNSIHERKQNICVVSVHEYEHGIMAKLNSNLTQNKIVFAQARNMGYININPTNYRQIYTDLSPKWFKVLALHDIIESDKNKTHKYEWYMWIDADALFTNSSCSFQHLLSANHHVIYAGDFNSGVFFIRNHDWSLKFLKTWFSFHTTKSMRDNEALTFLLVNETWNPYIYATNLSTFRFIQSYPTHKKQIASWHPGHCILHVAGLYFEKTSILHACLRSEYNCVKRLRKFSTDNNNTSYLQLTKHLNKNGYN